MSDSTPIVGPEHGDDFSEDEAWFWTPGWQAGEREVDAHDAAGRVTVYEPDEFIAGLEANQHRRDPA